MYRVTHKTEYTYVDNVTNCYNTAHLIPVTAGNQNCARTQILIKPTPASYREFEDHFGNRSCYFEIHQSHTVLSVTSISDVERSEPDSPVNNGNGATLAQARTFLDSAQEALDLGLHEYRLASPLVPTLKEAAAFARPYFPEERSLEDSLHAFNAAIFEQFEYDPAFSDISTPVDEILQHRKGVCQDFAHLAIAGLRALGLCAGYVSGYLETLPPPGKEKLQGADASHAWFRAFVPGRGWLEFDPTNNLVPGARHITLAYGRDYADVAPLRGVIQGGGKHELDVEVDVIPVQDANAPADG